MRGITRCLLQLVFTVLLGGLLSATLVRFAPGYGMSEDLLDTRRSTDHLQRLSSATAPSLPVFYARFLGGYLHGDLGSSATLERPVRDLIAERAPTTLRAAAIGLTIAWTCSYLLSLTSLYSPALSISLGNISGGMLQCVPAGVVALLLFLGGWQTARAAGIAAGILIYPRVVQYLLQFTTHAWQSPHVRHARAKGLAEWRVFVLHVLPVCAPQLLSLLGLSLVLSLGALIPVEAILDVPGIGQLAWQAALSRDLNLLVNITVMITALVTFSNLLTELGSKFFRGGAA